MIGNTLDASLGLSRVLDAVRIINAPTLTCGIRFEIVVGLGTACWVRRPEQARPVIQVDEELAEQLPLDCLQALLIHEMMHHVGYNHRLLAPNGKNPLLVNLALDIILERTLSENPRLRESLRALNDRLFDSTDLDRNSPLAAAMVFLVHSAPPFERMPRGFKIRWQQIWKRKIRFTAEDIYSLLASIKGATSLTELPGDTPYHNRYQPEVRINSIDPFTPPDTGQTLEQGNLSSDSLDEKVSTRYTPMNGPIPQLTSLHQRTTLSNNGSYTLPPLTIEGWTSYLHETLSHFSPQCIQVVAERKANFSRPATWLKRQLRFDPNTVLRHLIGHERSLISEWTPFLTHPTPAAIADFLSGRPQLYYENIRHSTPTLSAVYFDVSGSMDNYLPLMVAFASTLQSCRPAHVYTFDHAVAPTTLANVARGQINTCGATSIDSVLRHVLRHRPRQFFVVTDNEDHVSQDLMQQLTENRIESLALIFGTRNHIPWDKAYYVKA